MGVQPQLWIVLVDEIPVPTAELPHEIFILHSEVWVCLLLW